MPEPLTVTEKRISSRVRALDGGLCEAYERHFRQRADDEFWTEEWKLQATMGRVLSRRPIGNMQIQAACKAYTRGFLELCVAGRTRDRERKASRTADPQVGEGAV